MNYFYRFLIFLDPQIRQLHADNQALAQSLKVRLDRSNHPICERDRLFSIDFDRSQQQFCTPVTPLSPARSPLSFDLRGFKIYPDNYLN